MIISDAYHIPNVRIKLSGRVEGGDFKFNDYFLSVKRSVVAPVKICGDMCLNELLSYKEGYKEINFNKDALLSVAPFEVYVNGRK